MSMIARGAARTIPRVRNYAVLGNPSASEFVAKRQAAEAHAAHTSELWRRISTYVCLPAIAACAIWAYGLEKEHKAHLHHLAEENDGHVPQPPAYDYLNRRVKPFPWGMNSLFFNPEVNKDVSAEE